MANRRMQDSDYLLDSEDDPIGLTSAFPPAKGPQSVDYDKGDQAIGLTGAFAPIPDQNEPHAWDEAGKWKDFDWEAYEGTARADESQDGSAAAESPDEADHDDGGAVPETAADAESAAPAEAAGAAAGQFDPKAAAAAASARGSGRGRHAAPDAAMSPRMQQAKKRRRTLIVLVILVVLVIAAVGYYTFRTFSNSQQEAAHQAQEQIEAPKDDITGTLSDGAGEARAKLTDVPYLASVLGMTLDEAISTIGHGAMPLPAREVNEEGNPVKFDVSVPLNDEPIDPKTGAPTVYLGFNQDWRVVQVGYSASASALGFGSLSFADAVNSEHVVEKTLSRIGVDVPQGSATLPADKSAYSTYASDGATVTRERCSFEGDVDVNGAACSWSAVLSYDYTTQMVTGDLSDTVRIIYVYVTRK